MSAISTTTLEFETNLPIEDQLQWISRDGSLKNIVLFFIPGNPGLVDFYKDFLSQIYAQYESIMDIYTLSHLGHVRNALGERKIAQPAAVNLDGDYLETQVQHKLTYVRNLDARYQFSRGKASLIIMGHSAGSYIASRVLKELPQLVSRVVLLFPTLCNIAKTPNGKRMTPIFKPRKRALISNLALVLYFSVPAPIRQFFIRLISKQSRAFSKITDRITASPSVVRSMLSLADSEMRSITELDEQLVRESSLKIYWMWASPGIDGWVRPQDMVYIDQILDAVHAPASQRLIFPPNIEHNFVESVDQTKAVSDYVVGLFDDMLKHPFPEVD